MPYKENFDLSDIKSYLLDSIKDFIEEILDLSKVYGEKVVMPVAILPKKTTSTGYPYNSALVSSYGVGSIFSIPNAMGDEPKKDTVKGIYQDEALLQESAEARLKKIITLKKLGVIRSVSVDNAPLEQREVSFYILEERMKKLFEDIERRIEENERSDNKKTEENEIYYNEKNSTINLEEKSVKVVGWEDAICKVFFSNTNENKEIDLGEIIFEATGEEYQKSQSKNYMEAVRQAVYRLDKKIEKNFNKKDYFDFSTKTRKLTKSQTN